jgi:hypothetical protein
MDEIQKLSQAERNRLVEFITQIDLEITSQQPSQDRILGLGKNKNDFWMSEDFDDELPESFWFSDNDPYHIN